MRAIQPGIDRFLADPFPLPGGGKAGVLCNANTVTTAWSDTVHTLRSVPGLHLERIFSPQHGFGAEKQDNMVESADVTHPALGLPVISLYGERREPSTENLSGLDVLFIDLQDVGTRVYTFLVTALLTMRRAADCGLPVVLLDRPNPIGGEMEGPVLEDDCHSFVGIIDVPLRHGLTAAEYCLYGAWRLGLLKERDASHVASQTRKARTVDGWLRIVPIDHWRRSLFHDETGLPWTMPSPNMPTLDTAIVYPGQVALEGTNLSEGRGTTRPFELFGAPYIEPQQLLEILSDSEGPEPGSSLLDGVHLRQVSFEPTFHKHAGRMVHGYQIHVTNRRRFRPVLVTTGILCAVHSICRDAFAWRDPPYEYETIRLPIDLIYGTESVRRAIEAGVSAAQIAREWEGALAAFRRRVEPFLIYGE
jgi:uncharacterized protein YbbC (DUF1343 family)